MESSVKPWLLRLLVLVPVLCLIIGVVMWKYAQNGTFDIRTVKRELKTDFADEIQKLHNDVDNLYTQKREMQGQIEADKSKLQQQLRDEVENLHTQKREMQTQMKKDKARFKRQLREVEKGASSGNREKRMTLPGGGAVYVHWGRVNCSSTTDLIYTGITGGGSHTHTGAAVNLLCMTRKPVLGKCISNASHFTYLYGSAYHVASNDVSLDHDRGRRSDEHNVPCSVCQSAMHSSVIMIPGTTHCEAGWTEEYNGYLMAGYYDNAAATEYSCIDPDPDANLSEVANEAGRLLYRVKGKCGLLPCPPYEEMREITCVVCTK